MGIELENRTTTAVDESALMSVAEFSLSKMGIHPESDLSISIVGVEEMSELHAQWMDLSGPTDVLSFPMDELLPFSEGDGPGIVGDVVLCPEFAAQQAVKHSLQEELELLTVHGVLHCLGYDHAEPEEHKVMFDLQDECLKEWRAKR